MSQGDHGIFGVVRLGPDKAARSEEEEVPLPFAFRRGLVARLDREPNWITPNGVAFFGNLHQHGDECVGSRWPLVLWDTTESRYERVSNSNLKTETFSSLRTGTSYPAGDDCVLLWSPESGLRLFSSGSGAARWYYRSEGTLLFFSDHLPLLAEASSAAPDLLGLGELLRFGSNNAHRTLLSGISQVPYGHVLSGSPDGSCLVEPFLDLAPRPDGKLDFEEVVKLTEGELVRSIGAPSRKGEVFISGGVDSALLGMIGKRQGVVGGGWFLSMGSGDPETSWAEKVCQAFEIPFHQRELDPRWEVLLETVRAYGQPSLDFSVLPTFQIGRAAHGESHTNLILDGTGGDAWFGFHSLGHAQWWRRLSFLHPGLQKTSSTLYHHLLLWDRSPPLRAVRIAARSSSLGHAGLGHMCANPAYRSFVSLSDEQWMELESDTVSVAQGLVGGAKLTSHDEMLIIDAAMVAVNQFAAKSGHWSLNRRCQTLYPFLMPNMIQLALRVPNEMKLGDRGAKAVLKELVSQTSLGSAFAHREKVGFQPPLEQFLHHPSAKGPLARLLAEEDELSEILNTGATPLIRRILSRTPPYTLTTRYMLWALIYLKLWFRCLREGSLDL